VSSLFGRTLLAFLALLGTVAYVVPLGLIGPRSPAAFKHPAALIVVTAGTVLLLWCVREFYVAGQGTLAQWSSPRSLVDTGPSRFSRNPMYVGVLLILCGSAAGFGTRPLWTYAAAVAVAFHLRVVLHEEPFLDASQPARWHVYKSNVRRWVQWPW
jgi:protein-S-isoprenylcysteine O-methyltransferase Ste14